MAAFLHVVGRFLSAFIISTVCLFCCESVHSPNSFPWLLKILNGRIAIKILRSLAMIKVKVFDALFISIDLCYGIELDIQLQPNASLNTACRLYQGRWILLLVIRNYFRNILISNGFEFFQIHSSSL